MSSQSCEQAGEAEKKACEACKVPTSVHKTSTAQPIERVGKVLVFHWRRPRLETSGMMEEHFRNNLVYEYVTGLSPMGTVEVEQYAHPATVEKSTNSARQEKAWIRSSRTG